MSFGSALEHVGEDILHGIEWPFKNAIEFGKFLATAIAEEGPVRTVTVGLIDQIQTLLTDGSGIISSDGINLPADVKVITDLQSLDAYWLNTALPAYKAAFGAFEADANSGNTPAPSTETTTDSSSAPASDAAVAAPAVVPAPGLHNVVPA